MYFLHAPKLFRRPKGGSQNETTKEENSWGILTHNTSGIGGRVGAPE